MRFDTIVVGAGFAGMYMLYRLREAGFSVQVLETADDVGGTWYWNRYPGARCDVQSLDYSYAFSRELADEWDWSEKYATQPEILRYAQHVADRFDLRPDIQFETRVEAARWNEDAGEWVISTSRGEMLRARHYIVATGCLSVPKDIDIEGREVFAGRAYHTADWPREGVDFTGLRVGVIGTGSSAIQSIPIIAEQAAELTVFQRTPAFSLPAFNRPIDDEERAARRANFEHIKHEARYSLFGVPDHPMEKSTFEVSEAQRRDDYEAAYRTGTLNAMLQQYNDLLVNAEANETAAEFLREKIRSTVKDPDTAASLCPTTFPFGTKRSCLDTNYFETYNKDHVSLVDLRRTPLERITAAGVKTSDKEYEFDAIVFATGFDAMTGAIVKVDIQGRDGLALKQKWADGPKTYLGLAIAGFPNLFTITGPGSPSVMSNMMVSIEQHVDWIMDCLLHMRDNGLTRIEATEAAEQGWVEHVNEVADGTLFPQANSWYMGANVPGKPRVFLPYIGGVGPYRQQCEAVTAEGYKGFEFAVASAEQPASAG